MHGGAATGALHAPSEQIRVELRIGGSSLHIYLVAIRAELFGDQRSNTREAAQAHLYKLRDDGNNIVTVATSKPALTGIGKCIIGLISMRDLLKWAFVVTMLATCSFAAPYPHSKWQRAVNHSAMSSPGARIVVVDRVSGAIVASYQLIAASRTLAAPGSVLKPLLLYRSIETGQWISSNRVPCNHRLVVGNHKLACSHPEAPPFDAREALAWSCNSYFAALARALRPGQMRNLLEPTGVLSPTGLAQGEAVAEFREPSSIEEQQLAVLGVSNIQITPLELAVAYRWLANEMAKQSDSAASQTIAAGLRDSTEFGIASVAGAGGASVAGKTGTTEGVHSSRTHGWFAGLAPAQDPQVVIVVYVPTGRGADAARIAGEILARVGSTSR
jgi:cell division protein FtsI/penicillin-binding protein 2